MTEDNLNSFSKENPWERVWANSTQATFKFYRRLPLLQGGEDPEVEVVKVYDFY